MAINTQEIVTGAASIFLGPSWDGTAGTNPRPAFANQSYRATLDAVEASGGVWKNVGYTMEGLEVAYEPDFAEVEVDQILDSALLFKQSQKVTVNTTLAQATLLNLMISWGQADSTLVSTASDATVEVDGGSLGQAPLERGLIAVSNGVYGRNSAAATVKSDYSERVYHAYRVLQVESSTYSAKRSEATGIPVSFRSLPNNSGKYSVWKDRVKTW